MITIEFLRPIVLSVYFLYKEIVFHNFHKTREIIFCPDNYPLGNLF